MSELFKLSGEYSSSPLSCGGNGLLVLTGQILEQLALKNQTVGELVLDADAAVSIPLGALSEVHAFVLKTIGGKVTLRLTSADGATQALPVDSFAAIISQSEPFTALEVQRVSGVQTVVNFFMGEKA